MSKQTVDHEHFAGSVDVAAIRAQYSPQSGSDLAALCDEVDALRARVAELEGAPTPHSRATCPACAATDDFLDYGGSHA